MYKRIYCKRFALFIATLVISAICYSQQNIIGLNITAEKASSFDFLVRFGGTFERQFKGHHGVETGLYYRTFDVEQRVFENGTLIQLHNIRERFLSVPLLYKCRSSILNVLLGPTLDIYLDWKQTDEGSPVIKGTFSESNKLNFGLLGKISKSIIVSKRIILEPEARYNHFLNSRLFYGAGISFKYAMQKGKPSV